MSSFEYCLAGNKATAQGIFNCVNRHMHDGCLNRVEVRLSSQTLQPTPLGEVRAQLGKLLVQSGLTQVAISLRQHPLPMDDALGEHVVRLVFSNADEITPQKGWLRWIPYLSGMNKERRDILSEEPQVLTQGISKRQCVEMLKQSVALAVSQQGKQIGRKAISSVRVCVYMPEIDMTLKEMMPPFDDRATASIRNMLKSHELIVAESLKLTYVYTPQSPNQEGSDYPIPNDIVVTLRCGDDPLLSVIEPDMGMDTAVPLQVPSTAKNTVLLVRIQGTTDKDFPEPIELRYDTFPARFDRAALSNTDFATRHPALLSVISRHLALHIEPDGDNLLLRSDKRHDGTAMYFSGEKLEPLNTEELVENGAIVVVNGPTEVMDHYGNRMPAIVLKLELKQTKP